MAEEKISFKERVCRTVSSLAEPYQRYDSATPFYAAEWVYAHVFLNEESRDNLSFSYYPSGHMFYLEKTSFDQFRAEAETWYQ